MFFGKNHCLAERNDGIGIAVEDPHRDGRQRPGAFGKAVKPGSAAADRDQGGKPVREGSPKMPDAKSTHADARHRDPILVDRIPVAHFFQKNIQGRQVI